MAESVESLGEIITEYAEKYTTLLARVKQLEKSKILTLP